MNIEDDAFTIESSIVIGNERIPINFRGKTIEVVNNQLVNIHSAIYLALLNLQDSRLFDAQGNNIWPVEEEKGGNTHDNRYGRTISPTI